MFRSKGSDMKKNKWKSFGRIRRDSVYCFFVIAMLVCALLVSGFLALSSVRLSYYSYQDYRPIGYMEDRTWLHLAIFIIGVIGTGILSSLLKRLNQKLQEAIGIGVLFFSCIFLFVLLSVYIRENPYYPSGDQLNTTAGSFMMVHGDYSMLSPGGYIGLYQQQKGLAFFYEILFTIFGDFSYGSAKQIHVLFGVAALVSGYLFLKIHTQRVLPGILFCLFFICCTPFLLYVPYIYGDIPSICLCMVMLWTLSAYGKSGKWRFLVAAAVSAGCALLFRMNTWIVLIAAAIGLMLSAWKKWSWKPVLAALVILLTAQGAVKSVDVMYEYRSGYESGIGIPSILWIAMGLQETDGMPGIYNRYQQAVFTECDFQREPAILIGKEYIRDRLQELVHDPDQMKDFFNRKLQMQWLEPLFESLYATRSFDEQKGMPEWINELYYGEFHNYVWKISNYYQSIVYLALATFVCSGLFGRKWRQADGVFWIPLIALIGGFLFSIFWESQCRYVLPYYVFTLLYVPLGLEIAASFLNAVKEKLIHIFKKIN